MGVAAAVEAELPGSFSPEVSGKRACASRYVEKRAEYPDNWLNASVVCFSVG